MATLNKLKSSKELITETTQLLQHWCTVRVNRFRREAVYIFYK
jgi:hypothetical protein